MAGIIAVYALVVSVLIAGDMRPPPGKHYSLFSGFMHLACGLSVGLTGLAAGYAIGVVGDMVRHLEETTDGQILTGKGCSIIHATIPDLRRNGPHIDFWRSARALWVR